MRHFLRAFFVLPIRFYKFFISPILPPACRFYPTCSEYALEAIMTHGWQSSGLRVVILGAVLVTTLFLRRVTRMSPKGNTFHARR